MTTTPQIIVVTDANVLINLMHVARLDLCARLPGDGFVVPDHGLGLLRGSSLLGLNRLNLSGKFSKGDSLKFNRVRLCHP